MAECGQSFLVGENEVIGKVDALDAFGFPSALFVKLPGWKQVCRDDNDYLFACTRDSFTIVQNEVGHELFEALSEGARLDDGTGGTVKNGAQCYLTARLDEPVFVNGDPSPIFPYVVVTWAHDGSGSIQARRTSVRVVCWNTLSASEAESERAGRNFTFRHTARVMDRIQEAKDVITGAREATSAFVELANELAAISVTDDQREAFVASFIPAPVGQVVSDRVLDNIATARAQVRGIFDSPTIPEAHRNTAYGLVQAGIEYADHLRGHRNTDTYLGRTLLRDEPLKAKLIPLVRELVTV
jgi:phage/plasmid-like protein (TIGR03299 family)